jgi:uncharacterized membrane protein YphA (DoxX/SURF4 family)
VKRLFSTFAPGWPGAGLLLMRLVAGTSLIIHGVAKLEPLPATQSVVLPALATTVGVLLLAGLWTPVAGTLVAVLGLWNSVSHSGDPWACIFMATIGAGLALLGPGAWSVDSRLFGWKRIDVRDRKS